jgi:hypothetical protein
MCVCPESIYQMDETRVSAGENHLIFRVALALTIAYFGHFVNEIAYYEANISHMV